MGMVAIGRASGGVGDNTIQLTTLLSNSTGSATVEVDLSKMEPFSVYELSIVFESTTIDSYFYKEVVFMSGYLERFTGADNSRVRGNGGCCYGKIRREPSSPYNEYPYEQYNCLMSISYGGTQYPNNANSIILNPDDRCFSATNTYKIISGYLKKIA